MKNKRLLIIVLCSLGPLLIPLIAMLFTSDVNWTLFDFIVAGGLLVATGFSIDLVLRKVKPLKHKIILSILVVLILLLIWVELAVGVFGTPFAGS